MSAKGKEMTSDIIIKYMSVNRSPEELIAFFKDVKNWESGGALSVVKEESQGWWTAETPAGRARIGTAFESVQSGILDHQFIAGGLKWDVFCRVIPNQSGATMIWIFVCPDGMTKNQFEMQLNGFEEEIMKWSGVLNG